MPSPLKVYTSVARASPPVTWWMSTSTTRPQASPQATSSVRCLPGETGMIDLNIFLGTLQRVGYDGPVVVEPFNAPLREMAPEEAVRTTAEALDKV